MANNAAQKAQDIIKRIVDAAEMAIAAARTLAGDLKAGAEYLIKNWRKIPRNIVTIAAGIIFLPFIYIAWAALSLTIAIMIYVMPVLLPIEIAIIGLRAIGLDSLADGLEDIGKKTFNFLLEAIGLVFGSTSTVGSVSSDQIDMRKLNSSMLYQYILNGAMMQGLGNVASSNISTTQIQNETDLILATLKYQNDWCNVYALLVTKYTIVNNNTTSQATATSTGSTVIIEIPTSADEIEKAYEAVKNGEENNYLSESLNLSLDGLSESSSKQLRDNIKNALYQAYKQKAYITSRDFGNYIGTKSDGSFGIIPYFPLKTQNYSFGQGDSSSSNGSSVLIPSETSDIIAPEDCTISGMGTKQNYGYCIDLISTDNKRMYKFSNLTNFSKTIQDMDSSYSEEYKSFTYSSVIKAGDTIGYINGSSELYIQLVNYGEKVGLAEVTPTPTPSPSPIPTPTPIPTATDGTQMQEPTPTIEISSTPVPTGLDIPGYATDSEQTKTLAFYNDDTAAPVWYESDKQDDVLSLLAKNSILDPYVVATPTPTPTPTPTATPQTPTTPDQIYNEYLLNGIPTPTPTATPLPIEVFTMNKLYKHPR